MVKLLFDHTSTIYIIRFTFPLQIIADNKPIQNLKLSLLAFKIQIVGKMVINVEIISREMVKPSSSTPQHLKNLKLSFLDQLAPPIYVPMILFYQSNSHFRAENNRTQISCLLKQSLSHVLTRFYPLAGSIDNNIFVDCNDGGAEFVEAQVPTNLLGVIENPNIEELEKYLPIKPYGGTGGSFVKNIVLAIQINFFNCGGMVIGLCMSHKIVDGSSLVAFINAWAATARGEDSKIATPNFNLAFHFKPRDEDFSPFFPPTSGIDNETIVTKRFIFDKMKLATLKEKLVVSSQMIKDPTRVEAVSAFILKQLIEVSNMKTDTKKCFGAIHTVNLRSRMGPPPMDHAFGNLFTLAVMAYEGDKSYPHLAGELRKSIRKINADYVKKEVQDEEQYLDFLKSLTEKGYNRMECCNFSSWCRFPVYEADYGWGKPVWVSTTTLPYKNVVILMSTRCGEGIEAFINMDEDDMAMIEREFNNIISISTPKLKW